MTISKYTDLITSQHKTKPNFMAWLSAAVEKVNDGIEASAAIPTAFDVDAAVGSQLDVIGAIVGRGRVLDFQPTGEAPPVLDDANYRIALKAKIAQNQWDGTVPKVYDLWDSLFPDIDLSYIDNQNMTISALIRGQLDPIATEMVAAGYIVPKPSTVGLTIIAASDIDEMAYVGIVVSGLSVSKVTINYP